MIWKTTKTPFAAAFLFLIGATSALAQAAVKEHVPGRLLVKPADEASETTVNQIVAVAGAKVHHKINGVNVLVLEVPDQALDAMAGMLSKTGLFSFVERDFVAHAATTPNDPDFTSQWHLAKIQAANAWSLSQGSASIPIAIIDSGVDLSHPDLKSKLIPGWNFLTDTSNTSDTGCNTGHGTAVSGAAAAATNNLTGVAGVAWANTIMPLVVTSSGCLAYYSDMASAITYAVDHGVRIINLSITGSTASSILQSAVDYAWSKNAVIFAAAGNSSSSSPVYPAACNHVLGITATEPTDTLATFSNYGSWIKLSAPGDTILTTNMAGSYGEWWGTSLASPIAAGVGALALSANPSLTNAQLVTLLETHSDDLGSPGFDQYFGYGRVNAYKAVAAAKGVATDTTPPKVSISSPLSGATVLGTVSVLGTASDNVAVTKVELYVDGGLYASGTATAFAFAWISTAAANGSHTLTAKAYDAAGNVGSASVAVTVKNSDTTPPTAKISSPLAGATVSGTAVAVSGTAADNVGVTKVELYVDGTLYTSTTASAFNFSWNSTTKANGSHSLMVKAYDAAGNTGSASVSVNVSNTASASASTSTTGPALQIHADATEVTGVTNGSTVTPGIRPAGFTGKVVVNGTGSVHFAAAQSGNGVSFLNCCANTNNAYYKFSGTALGNIFHVSGGQISFYLKSRYSFTQRTTSAPARRYTFDVRDGNTKHLFFFLTQVISGRLQFAYSIDGGAQYYAVPAGKEDTLFGSGVILKVSLTWDGRAIKLYLNGTLIQSSAYSAVTPSWTSASNFDLGAYEYATFGGYNVSDDIIDEFTVN